MRLSGCQLSGQRLCEASIGDELRPVVGQLVAALAKLADDLGKDRARGGTVLVMFEQLAENAENAPGRLFGILCQASYNPKYQLWARCSLDEATCDVNAADLALPFEVKVVNRLCAITCYGEVVDCLSSGELALAMAGLGVAWSLRVAQYTIPDRETLLTSLVTGWEGDAIAISGPTVAAGPLKRPRDQDDSMLRALRRRPADDAAAAGLRAAILGGQARPPVRGRGARGEQSAPILAVCDIPPDEVCNSLQVSDDDLPEELAAEMVEYFGLAASGSAATSSSSRGASGSAEHSAGAVRVARGTDSEQAGEQVRGEAVEAMPPPLGDQIVGPTPSGYITRNGRSFGRISVFGPNESNRGVRCYQHASCTLAIAVHAMPSTAAIIQWLQDAEPVEPSDSKAVKNAKRDRHLAALRKLRDSASAARKIVKSCRENKL